MSRMRGMGWLAPARVVRGAILACVASAPWLACNLGLDVDALTRGCPECADGASDRPDARTDDAIAPCPSTSRGPEMIRTASLCIDSTEVTNEQYEEFLASGFRVDAASDVPCDPAEPYEPTAGWPPPDAKRAHPVTHVTWCAARAFCAWAGKRLCGKRFKSGAGGPLEVALIGQPEHDEWFAACSNDGTSPYPYGDVFADDACNGDAYGVRDTVIAGSLETCTSAGSGIYDLSGNVWEWIDACETTGPGCYARGGAFNSPAPELACSYFLRAERDAGLDTVGFRCCAP
jgi:sulfatase modifying factor 1